LANKEKATLFILLLAIYNVLLAKLSGSEDIVVGVGIAGRRHVDLEKIIGMFVNTLTLRNYPHRHKTFKQFLHEVKKNTLQAYENQDYLFEDLVQKVKGQINPHRNPLFDTVFVMQNLDMGNGAPGPANITTAKRPAVNMTQYDYVKKTALFDITVICTEIDMNLLFNVSYSTQLFKKDTIKMYFDYFKEILSFVTKCKELEFQLEDIRISSNIETIKTNVLQEDTSDFGF